MVKWLFLLFAGVSVFGTALGETEEDTTIPKPKYTLEEVLVTASRIGESALKLPAQITIIEGKRIRMHGVSELGDLSCLIPASNLSHHGYLGGVSTISLRSSGSGQTLFLLDGRPVNDPQNGVFNISTVPLCMLHRIEIMRGGASSLWGANAMGGVVNLVTKRFGEGIPYTRIAVKNGSHRTSISEVEFGTTMGERMRFFVSAELKKSDGFRDNSDYDGTNIGGNLSCSLGSLWEVGIGFKRYQGELGIPGSTTWITPNAREDDYRLDADLRLKRLAPGNETEIQIFGSEISNVYDDTNEWGEIHEMNRTNPLGVQFEQRWTLFDRHRTTFGLYGERVVGDLGVGGGEDTTRVTHLLSAFVQFDASITPWMNLFASVRGDSHSAYGRQLSPSIGVTLPIKDRYAVYFSWNRSFRAPNLNELYYPMYGNPDLDPEIGTAIDLGFKMERPAVCGGISFYRRWVKDMIHYGSDWKPYNIKEAKIEGVELDVEASGGDFLLAGFNLALSEAADESDRLLAYQPQMKAGGHVEVGRTFRDDKLEGRVLVTGEWIDMRLSETGEELPGYHLFHAKFLWRIIDLTVFYKLRNLFDSEYEVRQGYPMPGRDHTLGLEWELWD